MKIRETAKDAPFQTVEVASQITGLAEFFIRKGIKAGTIPCVRSGRRILINVPALLRQMGVTE